jgi:hypothetical protein
VFLRLKGSLTRDFCLLVFFMIQFPHRPLGIPMGLFQMFTKICGDIHNFVFIAGVVKIFTSVNYTGDKLLAELLLLAINYGRCP